MCVCSTGLSRSGFLQVFFLIQIGAPGFDRDDAIAWVQGEKNHVCLCEASSSHICFLRNIILTVCDSFQRKESVLKVSTHQIESVWWFSVLSLYSFIYLNQ